jgi:tetratricopeptide (TPR) repeat protein
MVVFASRGGGRRGESAWFFFLLALLMFLPACAGSPPHQDPPRLAEAKRLASQGSLWYRRGCLARAEGYFYQALETSRLVDDLEGMVRARNNLAVVAAAQGYYDEASEHLSKALELNEQVKSTSERSFTLGNLGSLAYKAGRSQEAERLWREALIVAQTDTQKSGLLLHLTNLGMLMRQQGRLAEAESLLQRALAVGKNNGQGSLADTYLQLGLVAQAHGDLAKAEMNLGLALAADKAGENSQGIALDLEKLGILHQQRRLWERAAQELDRSIRLYAALGQVDKVGRLYALLKVNHAEGGVPKSLDSYHELLLPPSESWESPLCQ